METFSKLLVLFTGNSLVTGEFPSQRPVTQSFGLHLNKQLSKQPGCWWFEMPLCSLWRHCNVLMSWWHKEQDINSSSIDFVIPEYCGLSNKKLYCLQTINTYIYIYKYIVEIYLVIRQSSPILLNRTEIFLLLYHYCWLICGLVFPLSKSSSCVFCILNSWKMGNAWVAAAPFSSRGREVSICIGHGKVSTST